MDLRYSAVGIQNQSRMALSRDDYMKDIERLATTIGFAVWNCSLDLPVRLVAVSEGGIGGWALGGGDEHLRVYDECGAGARRPGNARAREISRGRPTLF